MISPRVLHNLCLKEQGINLKIFFMCKATFKVNKVRKEQLTIGGKCGAADPKYNALPMACSATIFTLLLLLPLSCSALIFALLLLLLTR